MPPKEAPLSKKQLKKLEQEKLKEEQRKLEEEKRIEDEKEVERQLEKARLKKIQDEKDAKEEAERLADEEKNELEEWRINLKGKKYSADKKMKKDEEWEKFLNCDEKPDPTDEAQLTTFITQYDEKKLIKDLQVEDTLSQIQYSEEIVSRIDDLLMKSMSDEKEDLVTWCQSYKTKLREINAKKFEQITSHLAINADIIMEENEKKNALQKKQDGKGHLKDDKKKEDLFKMYPHFKDFKYGIMINPADKGGYRHKPVDYALVGVQCEVPRTLMSAPLIMKCNWTSYDALSTQQYFKDSIIGGVLDIECFQFLPQIKPQSGYKMKYDYEVRDSLNKLQANNQESNNNANFHAVKVFYTLPNYVYIHANDKLRVGVWDEKCQQWSTEPIDEVKYDPDKKQLNFTTLKLAPLAYIQERCIDYPYQRWELRCVDNDKALLDIQGKRNMIKFEIGSNYAMLKHKNEPELQHLVNKKMQPGTLLQELYKCGINLLPQEQDANTANFQYKKQKEAEMHAIQDISLACRSFYIKFSKWNYQISEEKVMVRIRENLEFDEEFAEQQEKLWKSIVWWKNKCAITKTKDNSDKLNEEYLDGTLTHSNLEILLQKHHDLTDPEAIERMKDLTYINFTETVKRFLSLSHLLTFTTE